MSELSRVIEAHADRLTSALRDAHDEGVRDGVLMAIATLKAMRRPAKGERREAYTAAIGVLEESLEEASDASR